MRSFSLYLIVFFVVNSCIIKRGKWDQGKCRPKKEHFKIKKEPFQPTDKINFGKIYMGVNTPFGIAFYPDGRMLWINYIWDGQKFDHSYLKYQNWNNCQNIGYWRYYKNEIEIEFFLCKNSGSYYREKGMIENDKIIFKQKKWGPVNGSYYSETIFEEGDIDFDYTF
ncbi:hypothetical protein [Aureibacter tunicatorum]|uniref:Uncharacterized protein n=1 Tax=Aureibacter tunicatorum TaxID=866807 RepID=A0AAE4BQN1_9BACT|nr:hypothetical protein [Aureibacter tunicatorum]MDR6239319.1 hypothetical protein [Aureibacter tunicatorum]BDD04757.1 hypothetical protein AUTU_22400 [Aureibacter tunicatorum]